MNIYKDYSKVILIFLFVYLVLLNFFQLSQQHWSSILDQDLVIIYNSLLVSSGYEQEYRGHPGYTTFFIIGIFFKFFSIFYDNFSVQQILISNNIEKDLQNLFIIARVINSFFNFFVILVLYKILKKLNLKENICIISVLLLVFYSSFYELLFVLRSELLSVLIVLISFYYLLEFIKNKKKLILVFYSGFFSCLSILAKMQAIFLIVFILFCLYKKYTIIEGLEGCNATEEENKEYRSRGLTKNTTTQVLNNIKSKIKSLERRINPLPEKSPILTKNVSTITVDLYLSVLFR